MVARAVAEVKVTTKGAVSTAVAEVVVRAVEEQYQYQQ